MILKEITKTINKYILTYTSQKPKTPLKSTPWNTQSAYTSLYVRTDQLNNFYIRHILSFLIFEKLLIVEVHQLKIVKL